MTGSDLEGAVWRTSSHSGGGNDCVELVVGTHGAAVRDSKSPRSGHLTFGEPGWRGFLGAVTGDRQETAERGL